MNSNRFKGQVSAKLVAGARQTGWVLWRLLKKSGLKTQDVEPVDRPGAPTDIDGERWRLRMSQEEDKELAPVLCALENHIKKT